MKLLFVLNLTLVVVATVDLAAFFFFLVMSDDLSHTNVNSKVPVRTLRGHCKAMGLKVRGTKAEVLQRLKEHIGLSDSDPEEAADDMEEMEEESFDDDDDETVEEEDEASDDDDGGDENDEEAEDTVEHDRRKSPHTKKMEHLLLSGKRKIFVPERYSPAASSVWDDDDSCSDNISLDSVITMSDSDEVEKQGVDDDDDDVCQPEVE